jgi:hypothetical protein
MAAAKLRLTVRGCRSTGGIAFFSVNGSPRSASVSSAVRTMSSVSTWTTARPTRPPTACRALRVLTNPCAVNRSSRARALAVAENKRRRLVHQFTLAGEFVAQHRAQMIEDQNLQVLRHRPAVSLGDELQAAAQIVVHAQRRPGLPSTALRKRRFFNLHFKNLLSDMVEPDILSGADVTLSRNRVASPKTPLLTRVALADDWSAGWLMLRTAEGWPPAALKLLTEFGTNLLGKRGWVGRRHEMRRIAAALAAAGQIELARAAKLLSTDPENADACREIADMLSKEMALHSIGDIVGPVISGWAALGDGWSVDEHDPIKAALDAGVGEREYRLTGGKARSAPSDVVPTPEELSKAAIIDNWDFIEFSGPSRLAVRGSVSGSLWHVDGEIVTTSALFNNDLDMTWIRTRNSIYRLGFRHHELQPILRAAMKRTRRDAYLMLCGITGKHTLPPEARAAAVMADETMNIDWPSRRDAAKTVGDSLVKSGRKLIARGWLLLAADALYPATCLAPSLFLTEAAAKNRTTAVIGVVAGWSMLAFSETFGVDTSDAIVAARLIGERGRKLAGGLPTDKDDQEIDQEPDGVVVLHEIGGTRESSTAKEAIREFNEIVGQRLPLVRAHNMKRVRQTLHDEFPHAHMQIDVLLTGIVEGEPIRWRPTLLVSAPGAGKSRLVRRMAEELHVGLHRYDGSGSSDNAFGGTPRRWSSGEHCIPLEAVRRHHIANPLLLIDEIDKTGNSRHNGRLDFVLMPFLEPETAMAYPDPYVESEVDLRHVGYVLTCNSDAELPGPLKDRLRVVRLPEPKREHLPAIVRGIVADYAREQGGDRRWFPDLDDGELAIAEELWKAGSVRRLRAIVERIIAYREQQPRN